MNKVTVLLPMTELTEENLKVRERALLILLKEFGGERNNRAIYACADEWCKPVSYTHLTLPTIYSV